MGLKLVDEVDIHALRCCKNTLTLIRRAQFLNYNIRIIVGLIYDDVIG